MKAVVRIELTTDWGEVTQLDIDQMERPGFELQTESFGLSLDDGKRLLQRLQQSMMFVQAHEFCSLHRVCQQCHRWNPIKDYRNRKVDTVFGTVSVESPRFISCPCTPPTFIEVPFSPLREILPERATPELQRLQAKLCTQLPYRQATKMFREFLPVSKTFNHVTLRNRTLRIGERIDKVAPAVAFNLALNQRTPWTLAIDAGYVRGTGKSKQRNFGVFTGRLAAPGQKPYVFAWVGSEVPSASKRLASLARARTSRERPQLSVVTDGANNTQSIPYGLPFPAKAILDWFHISMRVRHLEQIISGMWAKSESERAVKNLLAQYVDKLRWCFWHANLKKADQKLRQILVLCGILATENPKFREKLDNLDYRARDTFAYVISNKRALVDYGQRYRAGKSISTAMAESAVNQVINMRMRMCKRQQMRWTPRGAHLLAQVRCAVINDDLVPRLKAYKAVNDEISPDVQAFIEILQQAA